MVKLINTSGYNRKNETPPQPRPSSPIEWAQGLLARPADSWVILDTETTGFTGIDEVIEISVIDGAGNVLIDKKRFKPKCEIAPSAQAVHGITAEMLVDAPSFADFAEELDAILHKRRIIIYNAPFDLRMLTQTAVQHSSLDRVIYSDVQCAMQQYSAFVGEIKRTGGGYRWQQLPGGDHTSLGDCRAVLEVIKRMAGRG